MGSFTRTGRAMSYPLHMSPVAQSAAVSLLDEFRSDDVSLLDEVMRLFFSNSNLTVNLYPLIILAPPSGSSSSSPSSCRTASTQGWSKGYLYSKGIPSYNPSSKKATKVSTVHQGCHWHSQAMVTSSLS